MRFSRQELLALLTITLLRLGLNCAPPVSAQTVPACQISRLPPVVEELEPSIPAIPTSTAGLLSLPAAWNRAIAVEPELIAKYLAVDAAANRLAVIESANAPRASLFADYSFRSDQIDLVHPALGPSGRIPLEQRRLGLVRGSLALPVYRGGKSSIERSVGEIDIQLAELNSSYARRALRMTVTNAFIAVLRAHSQLRVARAKLEYHVSEAAAAAHRRRTGTVSDLDLMGARAAEESARYEWDLAETALENASTELNQLLGYPLHVRYTLLLPPVPRSRQLDEWTASALVLREELQELDLLATQARKRALVARRNLRPDIYLHGETLLHDNDFADPNALASVGVAASWNVLDGGQSRSEAVALEKKAQSLVQSHRSRQSQLQAEIRIKFRLSQSAENAMHFAATNLAHHSAALKSAGKRRQQGMLTPCQMIQVRGEKIRAEDVYSQRLLDVIQAKHELAFAAGH